MEEDDVPPLEDMSDILKQAEVIRSKADRSHIKQPADSSPRGRVPQNGLHDKDTEKKLEKSVQSPAGKSEKPVNTASSKSDPGNFGGFRKGFLFGGSSSSKPKVKSSSSGSNVKSSSEMPYITQKSADKGHKLPEVQQTLTKEAQKIAESKDEWLTDGLMKKIESNDKLFKKLGDKKYVEAVNQFQADPVKAMERYKDEKEIQEFLTSFCKIMGEHFTGLADDQDKTAKPSKPAPPSKIVELNSESEVHEAKAKPSHTINPGNTETLYTRSPTEGADMSVRSSTNPNQPTAEDERRMQDILANPEIRNILMDPKVMKLIETLKFNPSEGARILQTADLELRGKINQLVQCGLLQLQT
ncbi:uncharacterized protein LOC125673697 [Ostrea edulis]|uniref:uncharacterized protein LOC125673697 n=1 Tax=Ostrea edulis TaxID=37623 RepID=UPI0024AE9BAA|nr:uncharacterized protein LOC125673697 [Ostrea edulis]